MPVVKRKNGCYKVKNTNTKKCLTKSQAKRQEKAINASKNRNRNK